MIRYQRDGDSLVAVSRIRLGTREVSFAVPLGPWDDADPDAAGLRGTPVILALDPVALARATHGARRSGRLEPEVLTDIDGLGPRLLRSTAEVIAVEAPEGAAGGTLAAVRALGGRPLPAPPLPDAEAVGRFLAGCPVDLDLAIPSSEPARGHAREVVLELGLDATHQIVEVDPRAAFAGMHGNLGGSRLAELTAAATGVLAGRVAAENRRWRQDG